jgi:YidC/Oxa1 family membrane protein insertase
MSGFLGVPVDAAYHIVTALSAGLAPLAGPLAVAAAIVVFTIAVRLLVLPFTYYALRGQAAQARLAPQVQALRQRYAKEPDRLRCEVAALYEKNGTSMYTGCLPLLLQWPFLSVMYLLFRSPAIGGSPNSLLAHYLFGARLGSHLLSGAGLISGQGAVFAALLVLLAAVGWLSARAARRLSPSAPAGLAAGWPGTAEPGAAKPAADKAGSGKPAASRASAGKPATHTVGAGTAGAGQPGPSQPGAAPAWLTRLTPYVTPVVAAFMPLAAGLCLLTTMAWTLLERAILLRRALVPVASE